MRRLVSIITPSYNAGKYIKTAINSVLRQSYTAWEMIIVDDGSTDDTSEIISAYKDERIIYHHLEKNSGVATAMNTALNLAQGQLIAFLDADDYWKENKLERQVRFMEENHYGFTFSSYEIISENGNKIVRVPKKQNYGQYMFNTVIGTSVTMLDRQIVGDFRMVNIKKDLDSMTWARILKEGHIAYSIDESLACYRKVEGSISNDKWKAAINHWSNCRKIEKIPLLKCAYYFCGYSINALKKHYL